MAKRPDADREVLTSLPRSRPVRRSAKRGDRPASTEAVETPAEAAAQAPPARAAKPAAKTSSGAKPRATASAPRAAKPTDPPPAPNPDERTRTAPRRKVPAAGYAAPTACADAPPTSAGAELVSTTIQAAAELAQIGLTVGRQTLRSMLDRLPKP